MTGTCSKLILSVGILIVLGSLSVNASVTPGEQRLKGTDTLEIETLLSNLGYWIVKVDDKADASTRHAIVAFQKVEGRKRTGILSAGDLAALRLAGVPKTRYQTTAPHVEIDLSRQVLFLTDSAGAVVRILPVSSGNDKR